MENRKGEKGGWVLGWLGGFIWVLILSVIFLVQGKLVFGAAGLAIVCAAVAIIFTCSPWKHPGTPYWRLMLPVYAMFFVSLAWAFCAVDDASQLGLNWWNTPLLLVILIPFATTGKRRWNDFEG